MPVLPAASQHVVDALTARAADLGFDLAQPFAASDAGDVRAGADPRLPDFGRPRALAIVIGNTRALWPRFIAALRADAMLASEADPLDRYVELSLTAAARVATSGVRHELFCSHDPPPRRLGIQRVAHVAGLAHLASSHLCVHPIYGPWIALRAVIVVDADGPDAPTPPPPSPCDCRSNCAPHLLAITAPGRPYKDTKPTWRDWLAVRDACPVGREHRYDDDQLAYHYTHDRAILRRLLRA